MIIELPAILLILHRFAAAIDGHDKDLIFNGPGLVQAPASDPPGAPAIGRGQKAPLCRPAPVFRAHSGKRIS